MMSASAPVAAGGLVASLQSIGATGSLAYLGVAGTTGVIGAGVVLGSVVVGAAVYGGIKLHEHLKYHSEDMPCWDTCHAKFKNDQDELERQSFWAEHPDLDNMVEKAKEEWADLKKRWSS
jgi:hypothetical protein